jgi:hypothetical protein
MFHQGQRVRVIESTAQGKSHPAVGDIGYLSNMFYFPRLHTILMNLYITKSTGKTKSKFEHKKMAAIIGDVDFEGDLITIDDQHYINLTSMYRFISDGQFHEFPDLYSRHGLFQSMGSNNNNVWFIDKRINIVFGIIEPMPTRIPISEDEHEFRAWFHAIRPTLAAASACLRSYSFVSSLDTIAVRGIESVYSKIRQVYLSSIYPYIDLPDGMDHITLDHKVSLKRLLTPQQRKVFMQGVREIESMMKIVSNRCDLLMMSQLHFMGNLSRLLGRWVDSGSISDAYHRTGYMQLLAISSLIFRHTFLSSADSVTDLIFSTMHKHKLMPTSSMPVELSAEVCRMRASGYYNSSSLSRFFDVNNLIF